MLSALQRITCQSPKSSLESPTMIQQARCLLMVLVLRAEGYLEFKAELKITKPKNSSCFWLPKTELPKLKKLPKTDRYTPKLKNSADSGLPQAESYTIPNPKLKKAQLLLRKLARERTTGPDVLDADLRAYRFERHNT